jgi:hypothetical protein
MSLLHTLELELDEARSAFDQTGDDDDAQRIDELCERIKTTPPESIADCIVKLRLATQAAGDRDDDWTSLHQVGEFLDGG